jgi:hypothetical protein
VHIGVRIVGVEKQKLGNDGIGNIAVDTGSEKDNAVFQQAAVNIHRPLFASAFLYNVGY